MNDRDRLRQAFEENFDMNVSPGFRRLVVSQATARQIGGQRPMLRFALGTATAVTVIGATVLALLLHSPAPSSAPAGRPSPAPTAAAAPSSAQLEGVARLVYPKQGGSFVPCDLTGNQAACPFTARLQAQLAALKTTACFGCQVGSATLGLSASPPNRVDVRLLNGTFVGGLVIVNQNGRLLVDDLIWACPDGTGVSAYSMHLTGGPAGVQPYGLQPMPACATSH